MEGEITNGSGEESLKSRLITEISSLRQARIAKEAPKKAKKKSTPKITKPVVVVTDN